MTCKTTSHSADHAPIPWTFTPIPANTPLPEVTFDDSPEAMDRWKFAQLVADAREAV